MMPCYRKSYYTAMISSINWMLNLIGTAVLRILFWMDAIMNLPSLENLYSLKREFMMKNLSDLRGILYEKDEDVMALHTSVSAHCTSSHPFLPLLSCSIEGESASIQNKNVMLVLLKSYQCCISLMSFETSTLLYHLGHFTILWYKWEGSLFSPTFFNIAMRIVLNF